MASTDIKEIKFSFNRDNYETILDCLKDLAKINTMIKIKFDKNHVLFYARAGTDNAISAFKSFLYPIADFIIMDEYFVMDFIILNGLNFVKNLELFVKGDDEIQGKLLYKEKDKVASMFYLSNGKLNFNFVTGDYTQIKDITKEQVEQKMDPSLANFSFTMTDDQFNQIKKLVSLNKSEDISIRIKKNKLEFFDKRWTLKICDIDQPDEIWSFGNKYLKSIEATNEIVINMFDQFLLIKDNNISLMIGLELSDIH